MSEAASSSFQSDVETAHDSRERSDYKLAAARQQLPLSFLTTDGKATSDMASPAPAVAAPASGMPGPASEASEGSPGVGEPTEAPTKAPEQRTPRRRRRRCSDSFATYFPRVLKNVHQGLSLSREAVSVMDSFVKDVFECIAEEASRLALSTQRATMTSREIQTAVRLLLPGEVGKHAVSEANKAVLRYRSRT
ncbi:histone H2B-like [Pteropus medius]|uniref:histone H2B-like n=1 Tax=Pteropus vampyrus TaxID=132908 RepID=UPI00196ADE5C|nr:histone H2B-like [Pteropus giganteus]